MKTKKLFTALFMSLVIMQFACLDVSAQEGKELFVQTAKVGSSKIIKNGQVYDMYHYINGQAALQQDEDGTIFTPIRIVSELAGLIVDWDDSQQKATLTDPATGNYWNIGIGWDFAMKYNAAGNLLGQHWMYHPAELRGGVTYIPTQDIKAIYGFQIYERNYDNNTYVIIANHTLTLTYKEITDLCVYASERL